MPLPESGRITIEEICEEFGVTASSVDLSNDLGPLIDKTAGTRVKLTDFYGASASTCTAFTSTSTSSKNPCELEPEDTLYHNGSGTYPVAGDNVYTDEECSEALSPGSYKMANEKVMEISSGGLVNETYDC